MTFEEAFKVHNESKVRLVLCINNTGYLHSNEDSDPETCAFGLWIENALKEDPNCEILWEIAQVHRNFHSCAAEILELIQSGRQTEARECLQHNGKMGLISTRISTLVVELKKKWQSRTLGKYVSH